jgi:transcription elongation factor GreA
MAIEDIRNLSAQEAIEPDISLKDAHEFLKKSLENAENHLRDAQKTVGEVGNTSDWHDNFLFDEAHRQIDRWSSIIRTRKSQLEKVVFIQPRSETDKVGLGNAVELDFEDGEENETFLLLGPADAISRKNCFSYKTPIGQRILGRSAGEMVEFEIDGQKTRVKIVKILPGSF